jgi:hypothetical protein
MAEAVLNPVRSTFRALATTVVPEASRLDDAGWTEMESIIEHALTSRPPAMRRQLRIFIRLLQLLPLLRYARRFTALDPERRTAFLSTVESSPVVLLRRGFWGLRTLVFMGYYARPAAAAEIGYRAGHLGWEARQ